MAYWQLLGSTLVAALFAGCIQDSGIVDIDKPENLTPLARFQGRAYNEGDTTLPSNRLLELVNPTIALVYHYIGPRENIRTVTVGAVASSPPFAFQIEMKQQPPPSIQNDDEVAVGLFWLFSDRNGNGQFDRGTHPEYAKKLAEIDSLTRLYYQSQNALLDLSDPVAEGKAVTETTLVGPHCLTLIRNRSHLDTVWPGMPGIFGDPIDAAIIRRDVLRAQNKWERFFDRRKRSNSLTFSSIPNPDFSLETVMRFQQRLFPKPGLEADFNQRVVESGLLDAQRVNLGLKYQYEAFQKGWLDYPFDGFNEAGADWGAGRSRDHFVFFFPTWKSIEMMRKAEQSSSFKIVNIDQITPGYNLLECNDQYDCRRLDEKAEIRIYLGKSEMYFNPPSLIRPFESDSQDTVIDSGPLPLDWTGTYSFQPGVDFVVQNANGHYWLDAASFGMTQLQRLDSLRGVGTGLGMQVQFAVTGTGADRAIGKAIVDWKGNRYVAVKTGNAIDPKVGARMAYHAEPPAGALGSVAASALKPGPRWYGRDTLNLSEASAESCWIGGKSIPSQKLVAVDSATLVSTKSDVILQWRRQSDQTEGEWYLSTGGLEFRVPPIVSAAAISNTSDSTAFKGLRITRDVPGSTRQGILDVQGQPRFSCSEDSLYLSSSDSGFIRDLPESRLDQVTVEGDGHFDLEIPTDSLSDSIGLSVDFCGARKSTVKGALIRILLRDNEEHPWSEWEPGQWLSAKANGAMRWQRVLQNTGSSENSETGHSQLWVRVENLSVPTGISYLAVDRYRVYSK